MSKRTFNFLGFLSCVVAILIARYFFQGYLYFIPCPICMMQRIIVGLLGFWFLLAFFFGKAGTKFLGFLMAITSLGGMALSARHLWLQNLPEGSAPSCGKDFYGAFQDFPFVEFLKMSFFGTGDCAEKQLPFMGIDLIPSLLLVSFLIWFIWAVYANFIKTSRLY